MDTTTYLAQLWGPVLLAVSLGMFVSRSYYIKLYRELEKDALAVLVFGIMAMAAGIAQILSHNVWTTLEQGLISFLGWATLVKGAAFVIAPRTVEHAATTWVKLKLIPLAGALTLLMGAYLTWAGYFM